MKNRLEFIVYLRALAITIVLYSHFFQVSYFWPRTFFSWLNIVPFAHDNFSHFWHTILYFPKNIGQIGVGIFFLVSGFVIPFSLEKYNPINFLARRILRLYPTLVIAILIWGIVSFLYSQYAGLTRNFHWNFFELLVSPFGFPNHFIVSKIILWTLVIEWQFYIISVVVFSGAFFRKQCFDVRHVIAIIIITWLCLVYSQIVWHSHMYSQECFMLPIGAAYYLLYRRVVALPTFITLTAFSFTLVCMGKNYDTYIFEYSSALVIWHIFFIFRNRIKSVAAVNFIADISYPLYLLQIICYFGLSYLVNSLGLWISFAYVISFSILIPLACFVHKYIEKPCMLR